MNKHTPYSESPNDKLSRAKLFTQFDVYKGGVISYEEILKGYEKMDPMIGFITLYTAVLVRAYHIAK